MLLYWLFNGYQFCACLSFTGVKRAVTLTGKATVALKAKREADEKPSDDDCVIYRYGSFCTGIEVFGNKYLSIICCNTASHWTSVSNHLVFVFRGHRESGDCPNGQCSDGNTENGPKCLRYHCYLPGEVKIIFYKHVTIIVKLNFFCQLLVHSLNLNLCPQPA